MLVKHMGECLTKYAYQLFFQMFISVKNIIKIFKTIFRPIGNGRKWTFFIVQSTTLVSQQANYLRRHLPWNIGEFSSITEIDFRSQEQCYKIIEEYQVSTRIFKKSLWLIFFTQNLFLTISILFFVATKKEIIIDTLNFHKMFILAFYLYNTFFKIF